MEIEYVDMLMGIIMSLRRTIVKEEKSYDSKTSK